MALNKRLALVVFLFYQVTISYQWNPPSFISNWITITSPVLSNPEFQHGFNELPVKVDVQIKVVNNGAEYVFTGTGTMHRDDDELINPLGGIVYVYNAQKVVLYPPTTTGIGVAYSGSNTDFNGPCSARGLYNTALVRVRAWKASDFPDPLFTLSIPVSANSTDCFKQQAYNSVVKPDLVVAQVHLPTGFISEGQGNMFLSDTGCFTCSLSGVLFGYDSGQVKLWVPVNIPGKNYSGAVFSYGDGFGYFDGYIAGHSDNSGTVVLKGYELDKAFQTTFTHGTTLTSPNDISFGSPYSLDRALVMVQVRQHLGTANNPGMVFNGAGSAMPGYLKYSGVVYAYNENSALLYTPASSNPNGYMVYLGDRWGNEQHPSSQRFADVIVTVFSDIPCPDPTVDNTSYILTNGLIPGSTVKYTCDCGLHHTSGNITRYCNSTSNWEGDPPTCTITPCADPGDVFNATYAVIGNTAIYTCISGSSPVAGDTVRTCQPGGSWSGIPVVCVNVQCIPGCPDPGIVYNATYTVFGQLPGDTATYTCVPPSTIKAGNAERICQADGTWSGIPLVCEVITCVDPGDVYNATYTVIGETATYTCISGSSAVAGDTVRTCQPDGSWTGIPVVCVAIQNVTGMCTTCADPGDVFNATYTVVGNTATYTCISGSSAVAGDTVRTCQSDGSWSGIPVVCVNVQIVTVIACPDPGEVYDATYALTGETATYTCISGSSPVAGDTVRTCQPDGSWSGIPVVCVAIHNSTAEHICPNPGNVYDATYNVSGQLHGDKATYACVPPSTIKAGNAERTCQADGTWSGIPLVCELITCADPGDVYNATYTVIGDTATYTCISGSSPVAGDTVRTCQPDGSWSGIPVVCVDIHSDTSESSHVHPVIYTSESLAECIEQTKKNLTVEKKSTSAYKRRLTSAKDTRPSAIFLGTGGVAVLFSVVLAVIGPDILVIIRNFQNFATIYKAKPKK